MTDGRAEHTPNDDDDYEIFTDWATGCSANKNDEWQLSYHDHKKLTKDYTRYLLDDNVKWMVGWHDRDDSWPGDQYAADWSVTCDVGCLSKGCNVLWCSWMICLLALSFFFISRNW